MAKTALVVGASGIVGSAIAALLVEQGWTVHGLARRPTGQANVHPVPADLQDAEATKTALFGRDPDAVFITTWLRQDSEAENTAVLQRPQVPHEVFATYWRDVHGPLCSRVPGLAWYVQYHLDREQDAHLWPSQEGIVPFPDYVLDGGVDPILAVHADLTASQNLPPIHVL